MSDTIHLRTSEGDIFPVELEDVKCSGTIKAKLDQNAEGDEKEAVYLEKVNAAILRKILEWAKHHKGDKAPAENGDGAGTGGAQALSEWDEAYLKRQGPGDLFELIVAADYLDIKPLLDMTTQKVALMIKGKTVEDIRKAFHIRSDFTDAEYQQILKENEWCEEK